MVDMTKPSTIATGWSSKPSAGRGYRLRLPLQVVAACGVIILLAIVVSLLSWQTYTGTQRALLSASHDTVGYIREAISEKSRRMLEPAEAQVSLMAQGNLADAVTLTERLRYVPLVNTMLARNPLLEALYFGFPDGDFILFRQISQERLRMRFQAPPSATFMAQTITSDAAGNKIGEYRFYDAESHLVGARIDPNYRFDPRERSWYQAATGQAAMILTDPYVFFTTAEVGVTLAQRTVDGGAVVGADLRISSIAEQIGALSITPSTEIAVINDRRQILGYRNLLKMSVRTKDGQMRVATLDELGNPPLLAAAGIGAEAKGEQRSTVKIDGAGWQVIQSDLAVSDARQLRLLIAIPESELFAAARELVWKQVEMAAMILLLAMPLAWWFTKWLVKPLRRLANETARIERFDFSSDAMVQSPIREISNLGFALERMKRTIRKFLKIGKALGAEQNFRPLLDLVLRKTVDLVRSDGGAIFLISEDQQRLEPEVVRWLESQGNTEEGTAQPVFLDRPGIPQKIAEALERREMIFVERHLEEGELAAFGLHDMVNALGATRLGVVIVPLLDRNRMPLGVLLFVKALVAETDAWRVDERLRQLILAVSGSASVAIQNKQLQEAQRQLIDALIKLVAGAIDAKSAYTGGHCQRVPVLTRLLAEAAVAQKTGPYQDFDLTGEEWEALDIAAWLHDCGKVTTPEFVVDKATKLETIYDRIHEIRMRFEVLKRDADIAYWQGLADGGDATALAAIRDRAKRELDDDFAFIAACNEGGEFMEQVKIDRVKKIAGRSWLRTISNRLGLSYEERKRAALQPEPALPVAEPLLADRYDHIVELAERDIIRDDNPWGFKLTAPQVKYNRGEVYNLVIQRGTLTEEERYRINDHIVQTIIMLESLPFPKHLKSVPELAGGHHEKMDGTGYPKRLKGGDMSLVARIMAIADVFEALTAADRPYKKAKKVSEAVKIMGFMKKDNHLDPDLLDLFLASGVWRDYARRFLAPDQIDEPDIDAVIGVKPAAAQ